MSTYINKVADKCKALGYSKVGIGKASGFSKATLNTVVVYVGKGERLIETENLVKGLKEFGAYHDTTRASTNKVSTGLVLFTADHYNKLEVALKEDKTSDITTDEQESLAAYYTACKFKKPTTDFEFKDFNGLAVESSFEVQALLKKANKSWHLSSRLVAERLYKEYRGKTFTISQRSARKFADKMGKAADKLVKKAGFTMQQDKWNPSDMWMVNSSLLNTDFNQFQSIQELNQFIYKNFEAKKLIGVSLKKVGKDLKFETYNYPTATAKAVTIEGYYLGKRDVYSANGVYIAYNNGSEIFIRDFAGNGKNVSGEIKGKMAAGGKVGGGEMRESIKMANKSAKFTDPSLIESMLDKGEQDNLLSLYYDLASSLAKNTRQNSPLPSRTELANILFGNDRFENDRDREKHFKSKIMSMEIMNYLSQLSNDKAAKVLAAMISYASSQTEISSTFIKISER